MTDLKAAIGIAGSGMRVQSERMRVVAQNIANSDSISMDPNGDPYRRQTIYFENVLDRELGHDVVRVKKVGTQPGDFPLVYDPNHPSANAEGYYKRPNVTRMVESQDMKEAQRSYEANVAVIETTKTMLTRTLDLLR